MFINSKRQPVKILVKKIRRNISIKCIECAAMLSEQLLTHERVSQALLLLLLAINNMRQTGDKEKTSATLLSVLNSPQVVCFPRSPLLEPNNAPFVG